MEKVSIIIPVYNTEKYLNKCIKSVLNQDYSNIELIIVNDGSQGNCDEIINSFDDKRIKYFKRENHGIGATRNFGIENSTGDYTIFLDSDDYLCDNAISLMVNKMKNDKLDLLITDYYLEFENTNKRDIVSLLDFNNTTLKEIPKLINEINLGPSNKMFHCKLLKNNRFPENIKYEDFALVLKLMDQAKLIGKINKPLFAFNRLNNGQTQTVKDDVYDILVSLEQVVKYFNGRYQEDIDYFLCYMCTLYASKQKYQVNKKIKNAFVDDIYDFLNKNVKDYKNNEYFKKQSLIKRVIQKNKLLLKLYIKI